MNPSRRTANVSVVIDEPPGSTVSDRPRPSPQNFYAFVPFACAQYGAPFCVKINVEEQAEYIRVEEKSKKPRSQRPRDVLPVHTSRQAVTAEEQESDETERRSDVVTVVLTAVQDAAGNLLELVFDRSRIPNLLIKVIGISARFQPQLYKLTVKWTPLSLTAMYQFSKIISQLTEICLDGSPLAGRNYNMLLEPPSRLYYLSLMGCKLDDEDCVLFAELLTPPRAAASSLHVLLLANNKIGNEGAHALAQTLRTNRSLHYLNLAGNRITDSGAISILRTLMEFPLTKEESRAKSLRHIQFLKQRADVYAHFMKELTKEDKSVFDIRMTKRIKPLRGQRTSPEYSAFDTLAQRANVMTDKLIGTFSDPFTSDKTVVHGEQLYCVGNMALCGLNLSYNDLRFPSITCLWDVLKQQHGLVTTRSEPGLLRVRVEGNNLPVSCCEALQCIDELLEHAVARISRLVLPGIGKGTRGVTTKSKLTANSRLGMSHKPPTV
ncbi:hypothetical protein PYW08_002450 [Mythimna loreyi]|uniref:Uncharacterized protein n=1 Tax=Mythimna loreyi TaxID=667449 RepID=A0ACC2R1S9_9NEOP|nr:hypothetical protein PYW08_002450 [Mythimna loreyi]